MDIPGLPHPPPRVIVAVAVIAVLMLLIVQPAQPATQLARWTPLQALSGNAAALSGVAVPLDGLELRVDAELYTADRPALDSEVRQALAYVVARFGAPASTRFSASLRLDSGCALHGIAYTDIRDVQVFTCPSIGRERAVAILAHEMVHQLAQDRYGPPHLQADLILSEGLATWGAGRYWLGGQPDFRSYVREQRRSGVLHPLATSYQGRGVAVMNALYYQWASFVEYLIQTYGRAAFDTLYVSGHSAPGSADYAGSYGKSLAALEQEWLAWVGQ